MSKDWKPDTAAGLNAMSLANRFRQNFRAAAAQKKEKFIFNKRGGAMGDWHPYGNPNAHGFAGRRKGTTFKGSRGHM